MKMDLYEAAEKLAQLSRDLPEIESALTDAIEPCRSANSRTVLRSLSQMVGEIRGHVAYHGDEIEKLCWEVAGDPVAVEPVNMVNFARKICLRGSYE